MLDLVLAMPYARAMRGSPWRWGVVLAATAMAIQTAVMGGQKQEVGASHYAFYLLGGLVYGLLAATVDLHSPRFHWALFLTQITAVSSLVMVPLGITAGLYPPATIKNIVAEGHVGAVARGADLHAYVRGIDRVAYELAGERRVFADFQHMSFIYGNSADTFLRTLEISAFLDGRAAMGRRMAVWCGVNDARAVRLGNEVKGEGETVSSVEALGHALFHHRTGDTESARRLIARAATLPAEDWSLYQPNAGIPWMERGRHHAAVLSRSYPDLAATIERAAGLAHGDSTARGASEEDRP